MASRRTSAFCRIYDGLDPNLRVAVDRAYEHYKRDPRLVDFQMKGRLQPEGVPVFAARINESFRALALVLDQDVVWYWLGSHTDYLRLLKHLKK